MYYKSQTLWRVKFDFSLEMKNWMTASKTNSSDNWNERKKIIIKCHQFWRIYNHFNIYYKTILLFIIESNEKWSGYYYIFRECSVASAYYVRRAVALLHWWICGIDLFLWIRRWQTLFCQMVCFSNTVKLWYNL